MPAACRDQAATSWLVEFGNGEKFLFDVGTAREHRRLGSAPGALADAENAFFGNAPPHPARSAIIAIDHPLEPRLALSRSNPLWHAR
jgi:hypothetical protein